MILNLLKKEMNKWSKVITNLQDGMMNLLEKVGTVQENLEIFKKNSEIEKPMQQEDNNKNEKSEASININDMKSFTN